MTRAILVNFKMYTPFGKQFYQPLLDFFLATMKKYEAEYDHIYLLDSNWEIDPDKIKDLKATIIKVNPALGYVDAYKSVLKDVKEDLVLLLDNDFVIYRAGIIDKAFSLIHCVDEELHKDQPFEVVSIFDTIGTFKTDKMGGKNKLCPYFFAAPRELLQSYRDIDWNSHMPHSETLGLLTEAMLNDGLKIYEWPEDKSDILFDGTKNPEVGKNLGYYHIRAGSTPAYLLASKNDTPEHNQQYKDYLKNQPKSEYLRQLCWYCIMLDDVTSDVIEMLKDMEVNIHDFINYVTKFKTYHGL